MSGPAVVQKCRLPALLLAAAVLAGTAMAQTETPCPAGWLQRATYCYLYKNTPLTYSQSSQDCNISNAHLVTISNQEEDTFLMEDVYSPQQEVFWIGLNDQTTEGQFKWEGDGEFLLTTSYSNWDPSSPTNQRGRDCVVYGANGWRLESNFCANVKHTYVCRQALSTITGEALSAAPPAGLDAGAIVAIIIVILVLLAVVVVVVVLVLLWKYCNDTFNAYICPCLDRKTRGRLHSLEQENQRLRQELSQLKLTRPDKLSMSFSRDSFDLAAMGSAPTSPIHPRPSVIGPNQPPPLQRVLPSKVAPATPGGGGLPRQQPIPPIFTRQGSQGSVLPRLSLPSPPNAARFTLQTASRPDPVTEDQQEEVAEEGEGEEEERERLDSPA